MRKIVDNLGIKQIIAATFVLLTALGMTIGLTMNQSNFMKKPECLKMAITKIYDSYDPSKMLTTDHVFFIVNLGGQLVFSGENNEIYGGYAKSWNVGQDKLVYTVHLRDDAKFSNGTPIRPLDVVLSLKRHILFGATHMELRSKLVGADQLQSIDDEIEGLKVTDKNSITFKLKFPDERFLFWLAFPELIILPENEARKPLDKISYQTSSGPFSLEKLTSSEAVLRKNPHFYDNHANAAECFIVRGIEDPEVAVRSLESGDLDLIDYGAAFSPSFARLLNNDSFVSIAGEDLALNYFIFNPRRTTMDSSTKRRAFSKRLSQINLISYGEGDVFTRANQFLTENHQGFLRPNEIQDVISAPVSDLDFTERFVILIPEVFGSEIRKFLKDKLQEHLEVDIDFVVYKEGEVLSALKQNDWDAFYYLVGMAEKATSILFGYHFKGDHPLYPFSDEVIKQNMEKIEFAENDQIRIESYKAISRRLLSEAYIAPIAYFKWPVVMRSDLRFAQSNEFAFNRWLWRLEWK